MEHKGIEYQVTQTASPFLWMWIVFLETKTRTGNSWTREAAILAAQSAIDKAMKDSDKTKK